MWLHNLNIACLPGFSDRKTQTGAEACEIGAGGVEVDQRVEVSEGGEQEKKNAKKTKRTFLHTEAVFWEQAPWMGKT